MRPISISVAPSTYGTEPDVAVLMSDGSIRVYSHATGWNVLPPFTEPAVKAKKKGKKK